MGTAASTQAKSAATASDADLQSAVASLSLEEKARLKQFLEADSATASPQASSLPPLPALNDEAAWLERIKAEDKAAFGTLEANSDKSAAASFTRGVSIGWLLGPRSYEPLPQQLSSPDRWTAQTQSLPPSRSTTSRPSPRGVRQPST